MKKKLMGILLSIMCMANVLGCGNAATGSEEEVFIISEKGSYSSASSVMASTGEVASSSESAQAATVSSPDFGVWYPYWDYDTATKELDNYSSRVNTICFFAAYYDVNNKAFIPEDTQNTYKQLKNAGKLKGRKTYLSFVNDKLLAQGSSLKDTALLYELIGDSGRAAAHADEVISLCKQLGCDGVEIDYEAIKKDNTLWGHFNTFVSLLSERCAAENMPLRIVFEPSAPIANYSWPQGAEYVMMCYNLNGYGTNPGPKANTEWLSSLCGKMKSLPGTVNMALATGGFDFSSDGQVKQIDYRDAIAQMNAAGATAQRDPASAAMHYSYTDESGMSHEVWYADQETIENWINTVNNNGINRVTIWRLGGNIA